MTETESEPPTSAEEILSEVAHIQSEPSGSQTFARYVWQAKQAVRQWIKCLTHTKAPEYLLCEHGEDIALIYHGRIRFAQLKTRDKGSWSVSRMCERGLDALTRSYVEARKVGVHRYASFELWVEGPTSDQKPTTEFVRDPTSADVKTRKKLVSLGLPDDYLGDFLERLKICPGQSSQADVDMRAIYELGASWRNKSITDLETLYERLLRAVESAQSNSEPMVTVRAYLMDVMRSSPAQRIDAQASTSSVGTIRRQILSKDMLLRLTPPLPTEDRAALLERLEASPGSSYLELKMEGGGASSKTIERAKELRALMDIDRYQLLASRETAEDDLERLAVRLLDVARATGNKIGFSSTSQPAAADRPAEAIAAELLTNLPNLAYCDQDRLFGADAFQIYGYLCQLSDECRFMWRAA